MDQISFSRTVLFVGDYFSLMTTVTLLPELRLPEEDDDTYAVRLAGEFLKEQYGWDVAAVSNSSGVVDEDAD